MTKRWRVYEAYSRNGCYFRYRRCGPECYNFKVSRNSLLEDNVKQDVRRGCGISIGFTLIEIIVVVFILSLLVAIVAPKIMGRTDDAKIADAKIRYELRGPP